MYKQTNVRMNEQAQTNTNQGEQGADGREREDKQEGGPAWANDGASGSAGQCTE